ncbi:RNase adapter protein RapZ [Candidatus Hakubella thermalkaliphila]|uniref:RNase adapter protein RapZ n=1 Tax=Candidatus Hakubella thermalkaliphila TaxID=2754717 RepID=A0A6V8P284_9ACTN|nr:RNase adapter protein RapZ [Candidatus Hakubella thermalkaliphila]GFP26655.1 RNase adapter protein RapZ [Candidatus Hakubella thermalkaliphila]
MIDMSGNDKDLRIVIITGLSGAGRSETMRCLEDAGYFCIDNLPSSLIQNLAHIFSLPGSKIKRVALVIDVRSGDYFDHLFDALMALKREEIGYQILFLEASDQTLVKRFKETRRRHPLATTGRIVDAIKEERKRLSAVRDIADIVIDTSNLTARELHEKIAETILFGVEEKKLQISVISFGYKFGIPTDADLVLDVRFLPNPYYLDRLRPKSGKDQEVYEFVVQRPETARFFELFRQLLEYLIPQYEIEGKSYLTIAIGCTGGRHRSVVVAEELVKIMREMGYGINLVHRDINKK